MPEANVQGKGMTMDLQGEDNNVLLIEGYGDNGFRLKGERVEGSIIVLEDRYVSIQADTVDSLSEIDLKPIFSLEEKPEFILVGTGDKMMLLPASIRKAIEAFGCGIELMDTGAAARTINVLKMENRRIATLLIAVD